MSKPSPIRKTAWLTVGKFYLTSSSAVADSERCTELIEEAGFYIRRTTEAEEKMGGWMNEEREKEQREREREQQKYKKSQSI